MATKLKPFLGTLPTLVGSVESATGGVCNIGFVRAVCSQLCSQCGEPIQLNGLMINYHAVCEYCYHSHNITYNVCKCPYRIPRSRKLPGKQTPMQLSTTNYTNK